MFGIIIENVVPIFSLLLNDISPSTRDKYFLTIVKPKPVPSIFVTLPALKNRLVNNFSCSFFGIPIPLSMISTRIPLSAIFKLTTISSPSADFLEQVMLQILKEQV